MGILDQAKQWMTPERAIAMQGIGMGLSQLGAGQPVNMSPAYQALQQRQQQAQLRKVMEQPGLMDGFSPQQRAILATMPESMAVELIMQRAFAPPPDPTRGVEINGQLVNPITGELMGDYRTPETAPDKVSIVTGEQAAALGLKPDQTYEITMSPDGSLKNVSGIGAGSTTINMAQGDPQWGQAPNDHVWLRGADGQVITQPDSSGRGMVPIAVPIPGSKAAQDVAKTEADVAAQAQAEAAKESNAATASETVTTAAQQARDAAGNRNFGSAGTNFVAGLPIIGSQTDSGEVVRNVNVLKSMAKVSNLQAMRDASPTGGALGSVSAPELKMLEDQSGALDPDSPTFERDLDNYERTLLRVIHGKEMGDQIFEQTRQNSDDVLFQKYGVSK